MRTLTIRLPDERHERLRQVALQRQLSLERLIEEIVTHALSEFDSESRFRARADKGSAERGLEILDQRDPIGTEL